MIAQIDENTKWVIRWSYLDNLTLCHIFKFSDGKEEYLNGGFAKKHPNDNHNKNIARKVSLSKALGPYTKIQRRSVWEAYFKMRNGKW